ncbi:RNA polymerase sigma factor [Ilumatobacter nonamiensis]|uniref:RNA polymerase sigma factor n=1 Tax=Ilumatobacter nonamiensis TaxID=467093 RepID=UPI00130E8D00|nr:sigma-70 family RNA polymerase sigma factor [Ilumatobacter nonamiensis]
MFATFEMPIRRYCARRVDHGSVDDVVNDTFAVAWRKIDLAPEADAILPWLYGVAYRVIQQSWRTNGRIARLRTRLETTADRSVGSLDDELIEDDERRRVLAAAASLAEEDQEVLRLTLWEELSAADAGTALGVSADAARQRASRARRRLADEFRRLESQPSSWARPTNESKEGSPS